MYILHDLFQRLHNTFLMNLDQADRHFIGLCGLIVLGMGYTIFTLCRNC